MALSKPRSSKEPRGNISKNSSKTNNDDWINFLKKKKDNLSEPEARNNVSKLEQTLKEAREKLRKAEETLHKEQQAHNETKKKSGNNIGKNDDIHNLLSQEKIKNKGLLIELKELRKITENLEGKNEERVKDLQRENARTVLELNKLKAWKEEALTKMAASEKFCESQTRQIDKLREENSNLEKSSDENSLKIKKMLKKKEFEIELLKGDLKMNNQIIGNMRTELDEMYVNKTINEGQDMTSIENVREVPNQPIQSPNTSILKKRKRFPMESFVSVKKPRADDTSNREPINDEKNEDHNEEIKQEIVVLDEKIGQENSADTHRDFVEDVLDEIFENIDYNKKKLNLKNDEDLNISRTGERSIDDDDDGDCWFIRELLVNMIDDL